MKRILFYTGAKTYGGHEITSLFILKWFLERGTEVECVFPPENQPLADALTKLEEKNGRLRLWPMTPPRVLFHALHHRCCHQTVDALVVEFTRLDVDFAFVSQGNLEISALGTLAARKACIPCLSYLPMAHGFREMGTHYGRLRDLFNRYLVHQPAFWLTCTETQTERLRRLGAQQPIELLPQPIAFDEPPAPADVRRELGIAQDAVVLGMCGRLNNKQKGCDLFTRALSESPSDSPLRACTVLLIGEGQDGRDSVATLRSNGWSGKLHCTGWCAHPEKYLSTLDLLVLPSRFEGLPHVILEALYLGIPVAAADVDGLSDYLPSEWLFPKENATALRAKLLEFLQDQEAYLSALPELRQRVIRENAPQAVSKALESILIKFSKYIGLALRDEQSS
ncbi:MAG TPA: hypothetical protein DCY38_06810 [Opitutae bacterium]|nr:hypothetical protein [Opitutae bacterium]